MKIVLLEPLGVSEQVLEACAAPLRAAGHSFEAYPTDSDPAVQISRAKDADVIMIANMPLSGEVIAACPGLKLIDVAFTGVDHVDLEAARARGVQVRNAAGYSTQAVAELAVCMMLSLLRKVPQVEKRCRAGGSKDGLVGRQLSGCTVGIVGLGAIGRRTAELCNAFGCRVLGYKRHITGDEPAFAELLSLEHLLEQSDIVTLHCPLNEQSRGLMNTQRLQQMKPGSYLINTARGPVVNTQDLANALRSGHLAGAGIDVFDTEPPLDPGHPLFQFESVLVTPHVAFASAESMQARAQIVFDNLTSWLAGNNQNVVL